MEMPLLYKGRLVKRYKRFLADVILESGEIVTAHCPNSGSMLNCMEADSPVMLSRSDVKTRKYEYTWEMVFADHVWVGINTMLTNKLVKEALLNHTVPELEFDEIRTEVPYGSNSRIDILLTHNGQLCYVEVKNVTLVCNGKACFPDAVTTRGAKHLEELMNMVNLGHKAVMFFLVQRNDVKSFKPAAHIDPRYSVMLKKAEMNGVKILVYRAHVTPVRINIECRLPYHLD